MRTSESLGQRWNTLPLFDSAYQRIDAQHPLEWHFGFSEHNQRSLLLITRIKPRFVASSKGITVSTGLRSDGRWALSFRLVLPELEDMYLLLCDDLIESSRAEANNAQGIDFVLRRYRLWLILLEHQGSDLLTDPQRRGLLGELVYLQQRLAPNNSLRDVVTGWIGPGTADQDFVYADGWHEVKAVGISSTTVTIASLDQLDGPLPGELVLIGVDSTAPNDPAGTTLRRIVDTISRALEADAVANQVFRDKLLQCNYVDLADYDEFWYRVGVVDRYRIDEQFPRLTRNIVPVHVASARYALSIAALMPWKQP